MKQVRVHGPGDVRLDDIERTAPGPRDVVVRVRACGVCGSDLGYIRMGGLAGPGRAPMALGHEMAGVVDWVGAEVREIAVGDRVVVHPGDDQLGRIGNGPTKVG
jgi:threonine dehydrogenase-like Zn-dependent dehydrogenase